jgi:hypothetical protein
LSETLRHPRKIAVGVAGVVIGVIIWNGGQQVVDLTDRPCSAYELCAPPPPPAVDAPHDHGPASEIPTITSTISSSTVTPDWVSKLRR